MALTEQGTSVFAAFNDPQGVDHFYEQEQAKLQIKAENDQWNAKLEAQRWKDEWEDVGIDSRMLDQEEHSVDIAEREGKTWLEFQLECLGFTATGHRHRREESWRFAEKLGFSPTDVSPRLLPTPPASYLLVGTAGVRKYSPRDRRNMKTKPNTNTLPYESENSNKPDFSGMQVFS